MVSVRIQLHASEMIAMLVLDQYLMDKLNRYVYRNGATVVEIPGLRIKVPQTDGRHRLNQATKKFKQQSTAVLHGLLCAAPIEGKLWAQVWDRHTPQDYWRYDSVGEAITCTDHHDEGTPERKSRGEQSPGGNGRNRDREERKHPEAPRGVDVRASLKDGCRSFLGIAPDRLRGSNEVQAPTAPATLRHHRDGKPTKNP